MLQTKYALMFLQKYYVTNVRLSFEKQGRIYV